MGEASESDRIAAAGVPLTLADGREVRVRYAMRSLKAVEDHFGSLESGLVALAGVFPKGGEAGPNRKQLGTIMAFLVAGLMHEVPAAELWDGDLVRVGDLRRCLDVISVALDQAMPTGDPGKAGDVEEGSGGTASTTPPPGASDAATPSSGT